MSRLVLILFIAVSTCGLLPAQAASPQGLPDFSTLAQRSSPTVVNISTTQQVRRTAETDPELPEGHPYDDLLERFLESPREEVVPENFESSSLGSGVIISVEGEILTNYHVIRGAEEIIVKLADRRQVRARVVGVDPASDLALLEIDADDLPVATIGNVDDLKVGEWVMAIGSPFGFDYSVTSGIVSAKGRRVGEEVYVPFIQTDVAINPGNSGGPLFNMDGEVVGINSQIYSETGGFMGVSFAIPVNLAMEVAEQLRTEGHVSRGWLGVDIQDVTRELAESFGMSRPEGALVRAILPESPAAKAGLKVGDIILEFAGQAVYSADELPPLVGSSAAGTEAPVAIMRGSNLESITIRLGELPVEVLPAGNAEPSREGGRLGLLVRNLRLAERSALGVESGGVLVEEVTGGPAYQAGLRPGDVILSVDGTAVADLAEFEALVGELPLNRHVALLVQRAGTTVFVPIRLDR
jgi:serine protease Do